MGSCKRRFQVSRRAFTVVEVLLVAGVVSVLIALALPILADSRDRSLSAQSLSNIRQMNLGVAGYATDNKDLPPVVGSRDPTGAWSFTISDYKTSNWFAHKWLYSLPITAYLADIRVAQAPGKRERPKTLTYAGESVSLSDYVLSSTLYATAPFFAWETQEGPSQFHAQRLDRVTFPSDKGVLCAAWIHHLSRYGPVAACCAYDVSSAVAFADLSASEHILRRMRVGMINVYDLDVVMAPSTNPRTLPGPPVTGTLNGVEGRDRE